MSYHYLNREPEVSNPSDSYQSNDQVSLVSISPSRERFPSDQNSFGSFLQDTFYPSNQTSFNNKPREEYEDVAISQNAGPAPSDALDSDIGTMKDRRRSTIPRKPLAPQFKQEPTASNIELLPLPKESQDFHESHVGSSPKEWKPYMLRKGPAILLVAACWLLAAVLEVFRSLGTKRQGFTTENQRVFELIRYFPTIVVICLGFAWKSLVWDLKVVTPYSVMSQKPTSADKSIWLNYIDSVEFMTFWNSARNRHWAMFLGLTTGLLCGILVPLANALTFISLDFPVHQDIVTNVNSQFSFDKRLSDNNGSLSMRFDYEGGRPYAAVASSRLINGKNSPWTVDDYAFESVDITPWHQQNATVSIEVQAFSAKLDCKEIRYTTNATADYPRLRGNTEDLLAAGCKSNLPLDLPIATDITSSSLGWLNVTDCSDDGSDIRLLATVVDGELVKRKIVNPSIVGVLCTPIYTQQKAAIQVNGTSGDVLGFSILGSTPTALEPIASMPVIYAYLNNPVEVDENSQSAYIPSRAGQFFYVKPQATFRNVTYLYAGQYRNRDVFFDNLFGSRKASEYTQNTILLQEDVSKYAGVVLAQVVSSLARRNISLPTSGSVTLFETRLLIRLPALRSMQGILIFMGIMCALFCTFMRPESKLLEDPGNIAALAVMLSRSGRNIEHEFQEKELVHNDKGWMLNRSGGKAASLECLDIPTSMVQETRSLNPEIEFADAAEPTGFKPLAFRWVSRALLILFVSSTIITLAVLMHFSISTGGFVTKTSTSSSAWSIVPSVILVLLGYCIASVHGVLESFAPYLTLRKKSGTSTLHRETHASVFYMPIKAILRFGSIVLAASSLITLVFPVVKVLAAGLYIPETSFRSSALSFPLDTSLTDNFEDMYKYFPGTQQVGVEEDKGRELRMMVKRASQSTEWTYIPDFGYPHRGGAMGSLVFTDFGNISLPDSAGQSQNNLISVNIPAIASNVSCISLGEEHFEPLVSYDLGTSYKFTMRCATKLCNDTLKTASMKTWAKNTNISSTSLVAPTRFQGTALVVGHDNTGRLDQTALDTPYNLWLGDFPSITESFVNLTFVNTTYPGVKVVPGIFNLTSPPRMVAVQCNKAMWEVNVDVELSRASKSGANGTIILPWAVSKVDEGSIIYKRQYPKGTPLWAYPQHSQWSQYNDETDSVLKSSTLWPALSKATNIFELLAAYQQFQVGNLAGLLDAEQLARAVENVYTSYLVEIITEMRTYTSVNATTPRTVTGTLYTPLTRMKQDLRTTIALCVLLSLMLVGLLYIFIKFPRESMMSHPPSSIAAQMSLLAGSKLVHSLREQDVNSVAATEVWRRRSKLGWWPVNGQNGWRWGIDIVEDLGDVGDHERFVR